MDPIRNQRPNEDGVIVVQADDQQVRDALRALALMPRAAEGKQRVVVVDSRHPTFSTLDWDGVATVLAHANVLALTDIEARRVGFDPAGDAELSRLRRDGILVADIPKSTIRLAAADNAALAANTHIGPWSREDDPDLVPDKTQRRRARLAARARRALA